MARLFLGCSLFLLVACASEPVRSFEDSPDRSDIMYDDSVSMTEVMESEDETQSYTLADSNSEKKLAAVLNGERIPNTPPAWLNDNLSKNIRAASAKKTKAKAKTVTRVLYNTCHVRKQPSLNSKAQKVQKKGSKIQLSQFNKDWMKTRSGYMHASCFKQKLALRKSAKRKKVRT